MRVWVKDRGRRGEGENKGEGEGESDVDGEGNGDTLQKGRSAIRYKIFATHRCLDHFHPLISHLLHTSFHINSRLLVSRCVLYLVHQDVQTDESTSTSQSSASK